MRPYICHKLWAHQNPWISIYGGDPHLGWQFQKNDKVLCFPVSCPSVYISDIFLGESRMNFQLNPMLSPSLSFIRKKVPEFFTSKTKFLLIDNEHALLKQIKKEGLNPSDFVIIKKGYYEKTKGLPREYISEELMEYIASAFLRSKGFIVDSFSKKLTMGPGEPDLFAIKIPELQNKLMELKIISGGFYLNELELLDVLGEREPKNKIKEIKSVVIEVESSTASSRFSIGRRQLLKYLSYGCYNEGYVAIPFEDRRVKSPEKSPKELGLMLFEDVGIITLSKDGRIILRECIKSYGQQEKIRELLKNVERIIKLALLKNLTLRKVFDLLPKVQSFYDLYYVVDRLSIDKIVSFIKQQKEK